MMVVVVVVLMTVVVCRQLMILGMRWGWISDKEISYLKLVVDSMFPPCHPRVQICKGTYIHTYMCRWALVKNRNQRD